MIDYDQMTLTDLVGYAKALRLESKAAEERNGPTSQPARAMGATTPRPSGQDIRQRVEERGNSSGAGTRAAGPVLPEGGRGSTLESDRLYAAWYERQLAERPEGHAAHRKRSVQWLMHPSHCPECGTRKIRYMAAQPEESHVGRNGRRLAETYGVK